MEFRRATGNFPNSHGVPKAKVEEMRRSYEVLTIESVLSSLTPAERGLVGATPRQVTATAAAVSPFSASSSSSSSSGVTAERAKKDGDGDPGIARTRKPPISCVDKAMGKLSC